MTWAEAVAAAVRQMRLEEQAAEQGKVLTVRVEAIDDETADVHLKAGDQQTTVRARRALADLNIQLVRAAWANLVDGPLFGVDRGEGEGETTEERIARTVKP